MRKALIGSFFLHAAVASGAFLWTTSRSVSYPPRLVYNVKLVAAAATMTEGTQARTATTIPPDQLKEIRTPASPPRRAGDVALSARTRRAGVRADSQTVASDVHRMRGPTSTGNGGRDRAHTRAQGQREGTDAFSPDDLEARGSSRSQPLRLTNPGAYSETYVILHAVEPKYPEHERERGIEGSVTVELLIDAMGQVAQVNVLELVGPMSFENSAINAVQQFEFQPPIENGVPSSMWIKFVIRFRING